MSDSSAPRRMQTTPFPFISTATPPAGHAASHAPAGGTAAAGGAASGPVGFSHFGLEPGLTRAITELGFTTPTPIQVQAIPPALRGRDLLACAMTGSGKTAAFLLPILHRLKDDPGGKTRVLILTPTRELAAQIAEHCTQLARYTRIRNVAVFGGVGMGPQQTALERGVEILVATPGRLLDHFQYPYATLSGLQVLVLDEADRMLDMGFLPDIRRVLRHLPKTPRQTLFFSATMPAPIVELSREMLRDAVALNIERQSAPATGVAQTLYPVPSELKSHLLLELLKDPTIRNVLAFTRTKHRANRLADFLDKHGVKCARIHGNRSQLQRTDALNGFKDGRYRILVATDIAARGIDIEALSHVVNFDVPHIVEDYIHRVGRTARASLIGDAWTLFSPEEEADLRAIERQLNRRLPRVTVPGFDYTQKASTRLEIPIGERIAAIRARKSEERARGRAKAEAKAARMAEQEARLSGKPVRVAVTPASSSGSYRSSAPRTAAPGSHRPSESRPASGRSTGYRSSEGRPTQQNSRPPQRAASDGRSPEPHYQSTSRSGPSRPADGRSSEGRPASYRSPDRERSQPAQPPTRTDAGLRRTAPHASGNRVQPLATVAPKPPKKLPDIF